MQNKQNIRDITTEIHAINLILVCRSVFIMLNRSDSLSSLKRFTRSSVCWSCKRKVKSCTLLNDSFCFDITHQQMIYWFVTSCSPNHCTNNPCFACWWLLVIAFDVKLKFWLILALNMVWLMGAFKSHIATINISYIYKQ